MVNSAKCEHEMDEDIPITPPPKDAPDQRWTEPGDMADVVRYKAACVYIYCKHCKCKGITVDDTGEFWDEDGSGKYY